MSDLSYRIRQRLDAEFHFKDRGEYLREGLCPACGKKELWAYAENPRVVYCGRLNKCGYSAHVRDLFDDMFKSWSEHYPQTETNPNAAADAYLSDGRGFDLAPLKGHYSQETFRKGDLTSATVRFQLTNTIHWERLIDRPERFGGDKARFSYGAKSNGLWWVYPKLDLTSLRTLWITEGIFNAIALNQNGIPAVSAMSSGNYPDLALAELKATCEANNLPLPELIWAFDNDPAGRKGIDKNHHRALADGWKSSAALPPSKAMGKIDWNDLHEDCRMDTGKNKLQPSDIEQYLYYGKLHTAPNAAEAGLLIYNHCDGRMRCFDFTHRQRTYWFELDMDKFNKAVNSLAEAFPDRSKEDNRQQALLNNSGIREICNAVLKPLYFQRNIATDESAFYYQIQSEWGDTNITFTPDQLSSRAKFKPRIMASGHGVMWTGNDDILERLIKRQNEGIREVKTIDFIGYSSEHNAYIFNKHAIASGRMVEINQYDYFKIGRTEVKTLALKPEIHLNPTAKFDPNWYGDFWRIRGVKGLIVLAWWTGSYFAEQIRAMHGSYPFMEVVGEAGAGKSRMIEFLWKLSGRDKYEGFDANKATPVGIYRNLSQVSNLPIVMIEGDRNDVAGAGKPKISFDEFKDAFNGRSVRSMGNKNNSNDTREPPFRAALMFSQNTPIQASEAMLTRTMHLYFDRAGQTLQTKRLVDKLDQLPLETACSYMTHCLKKETEILDTYKAELQRYEAEYHDEEITHTRIALCHAQIAAMIDAIAKHVLDGHIDLEHVIDAHTYLKAIARQRITQLSGDHPDIEKFWEVYDYMANARDIAINHHPDHCPTVAINLNEFYKWAAECRQQLPELNIMKQLLLTSKSYTFRDKNRAVSSPHRNSPTTGKGMSIKCWIFDKPNGATDHPPR